jgi:hypothetical protein
MAGDWLKVEKATARKPEVLRLAAALKIHPDHAFGLCFRFWSWCDDQLESGNAPGVTALLIDELLGHAGFGDALVSVGWLRVRDGSLEVPNFHRHLSESAKNRALTAQRVAKHKRAKGNDLVTGDALPREEKRRVLDTEVSKTPLPPGGGRPADLKVTIPQSLKSPEFIAAWGRWQKHRSEIRKPLKPTMASAQMVHFQSIGVQRAIAAIDHTIAMGWQGIREPELFRGPSAPAPRGPAISDAVVFEASELEGIDP